MALDTTTLKNKIQNIFESGAESNASEVAERLANALEEFVKSGTVTVEEGIPVTTPAGPGSTSGTGTGGIS